MINNPPTFAKQDSLKFFRTLNSRVNNYFKENKIEKTATITDTSGSNDTGDY